MNILNSKYLYSKYLLLAFVFSFFTLLPLQAQASLIVKAPSYLGLSEGLVGFWSFNGPDMSGNTATDRSGQGNNGTLTNGPKRAIGKLGQALDFDGVDDYVNVASVPESSSMSFSVWIYPQGWGNGGEGNIFAINNGANEPYIQLRVRNDSAPLEALRAYIRVVGGSGSTITVANSITLNTWQHIVYTFDSIERKIRLYRNGIEMSYDTQTTAPAAYGFSGKPFWIGDNNNPFVDPFDGVNDYVNPDDAINTLFNTLAQGTISAWVKWESGTGAIFSRGNSTFISDGQLKFYIDSSANLDIYSTASSFGSRALDASFALSNPTSWHHVVFTNDTSGNKFYVDGKQTTPTYSVGNASTDFFFDDMPSSIHCYEIGGVVDTDDETFNGLIDDVRIYNRALSEQEIKRLYKIGSTLKVNVTRKDTLTNGLVGHWSFDGPDMNATQALDTTGNANNGTLTNGPKRAIGKLGQALDFDGVDDYVNAGTGSSLSLLGPVTISAWIYPRTFGGASKGRIVGRGTSGIANSVGFSVNNSDITAGLSFGSHYDVLSLQTYSSNNTITLNTWQHVTVTWDGTTDRTKVLFYVNGIKTGRQDNGDGSDGSVTRVSDSTCSLLIGVQGGDGGDCNVDNGTRDFNGQIDEVRIYNRVLSADEIKRLYNMGR